MAKPPHKGLPAGHPAKKHIDNIRAAADQLEQMHMQAMAQQQQPQGQQPSAPIGMPNGPSMLNPSLVK
jgi:hypothetical protein